MGLIHFVTASGARHVIATPDAQLIAESQQVVDAFARSGGVWICGNAGEGYRQVWVPAASTVLEVEWGLTPSDFSTDPAVVETRDVSAEGGRLT